MRRIVSGVSTAGDGAEILIVDDDADVVASLRIVLRQHGYRTREACSPDEALKLLSDGSPDLVLQDMNFSRTTSGEEGLALLDRIREAAPLLPVVLITAWGSIDLAVEGMKRGAADFISKPWGNAQLLSAIETALSLRTLPESVPPPAVSRQQLDAEHDFSGIIGDDSKVLRVLELVARVAPTDASVLITGPSGTGKELIAEAIHRNSRRRSAPFVKVNLGGISSTLFESEMFGHVRGAFTDARENRKGRFEVADGGTIFLDEIGEVEASSQVKLLRVLQDRSYEVLGSSRARSVDVRVVSATNQALGALVAAGRFREDLLYRLNLITIHLPPLAERRGDIRLLAEHFLATFSRIYGRQLNIAPTAMRWLEAQSWPGNIRQMRQVIERAVLVSRGSQLELDDFLALHELERRSDGASERLPLPGTMTLDEIEKAMIVRCLTHYEGNVTRVAEALGLSRAALYRRFEKYGIEAS
jgi:two-component system, NtrC family, response regulator